MRIGITGGVGTGKSTVLGWLADWGVTTASADAMAREILERPEIQSQISALSGLPMPLTPEGVTAWLGHDVANRRALNRIMHPLILEGMIHCHARVIEVPLLIETCLPSLFDEVWVVVCDPQTQRERLLARWKDEARVDAMLAAQLALRAKVPFADVLIRTNLPMADVHDYVFEQFRKRRAQVLHAPD